MLVGVGVRVGVAVGSISSKVSEIKVLTGSGLGVGVGDTVGVGAGFNFNTLYNRHAVSALVKPSWGLNVPSLSPIIILFSTTRAIYGFATSDIFL